MELGESTKQSENPEGRSQREVRRRRRSGSGAHDSSKKFSKYVLIPLAVIVALSVFGYLVHQPVLRQLRAWRSIAVVESANKDLEAGRLQEAGRSVRVALGLAPSRIEVQKLAARFYQAAGNPESLDYWKSVTTSPGASLEDRYSLIDACLQFSRPDVAYEQLNLLEPSVGKAAGFLRRVVRYLILINDYDAAVPYAREAQVSNPVDEEFEYLLGYCLLKSSRADWSVEGRRLLMSIALTSGSEQATAARTLQETGRLPMVDARQIARAIERRSQLSLSDRLLVAGLRAGPDRAEREALVASVLTEIAPTTDEDRLRCATWALSLETPRAAKNLLAANVTTNRALNALKLEAFALDEDWSGLEGFVAGASNLVDEAVLQSIQGWKASKDKDLEKANSQFETAIEIASKRPIFEMIPTTWTISVWAERAQLPLTAIKALESLLPFRFAASSAANAVTRIAKRLDTVEPAYSAHRALWQYAPNEDRYMVEFGHAALLLNRDVEEAVAVCRSLNDRYPRANWPAAMLAYGLVRTGKNAEAAELMETRLPDDGLLGVPMKVLVAGTRFSLGQREVARQLARSIPREGLKIEEVRILEAIE